MIKINLTSIKKGYPGINKTFCAVLLECCVVCFKRKNHNNKKTSLRLDFDKTQYIILSWKDIFDDQMDRTYQEQKKTTELAAECLSVLLVTNLTEYTIVRRTQGKNGFDYWLGNKNETLFNNSARLEISGIFEGDDAQINSRYNTKINQTKISDNTKLPALIAIIEFSNPKAKLGKR